MLSTFKSGNFKFIKFMLDVNVAVTKRLNFSGATNATQLQKFVESNIVHRQGFTWGAEAKKLLSVFIDDLNAPIADSFGVQRCNEVLFNIIS
jgi:dynein heavy chain